MIAELIIGWLVLNVAFVPTWAWLRRTNRVNWEDR